MRIGIDIDGVLADFNSAFIELVNKMTPVHLPPVSDYYPNTWSYHKAAGVSKADDDRLWEHIKQSSFWASLLPLPGTIETLRMLDVLNNAGHEVYFITSRPGKRAKYQTEMWLRAHGMSYPTVLIAHEKGPVVAALGIDVFIDDKAENCWDVLSMDGNKCSVYIIDAPYNRWATVANHYGTRVKSVMAALRIEGLTLDGEERAA